MKKLSLSIFAVLAIVLAVSSAFTTKAKTAVTYKVYGVPQNTYTSAFSLTVAQAEALGGTLVRDNGTTNQSIATTFSQTSANDGCNSDTNFHCAGEVEDNNGTKTVTESVTGDFHAN